MTRCMKPTPLGSPGSAPPYLSLEARVWRGVPSVTLAASNSSLARPSCRLGCVGFCAENVLLGFALSAFPLQDAADLCGTRLLFLPLRWCSLRPEALSVLAHLGWTHPPHGPLAGLTSSNPGFSTGLPALLPSLGLLSTTSHIICRLCP